MCAAGDPSVPIKLLFGRGPVVQRVHAVTSAVHSAALLSGPFGSARFNDVGSHCCFNREKENKNTEIQTPTNRSKQARRLLFVLICVFMLLGSRLSVGA